MKTDEIKSLLIEASTTTDGSRKIAIHAALGDAADDDVSVVLNTLYVSVMSNSPELLPALLPAFVVMCGDRDEDMPVADWQPEPPVTDATFAVGDRVTCSYDGIETVKAVWEEEGHPYLQTRGDDGKEHMRYGDGPNAPKLVLRKTDDAVTDERATDTPWQVRHRVDLMAFAYEVYKPDENYVINRVACSSTPIYLCGCGRYDCEHVDAVKAYIEAQAASTHSGFKWDGHNWQPIAPKAASDGAE